MDHAGICGDVYDNNLDNRNGSVPHNLSGDRGYCFYLVCRRRTVCNGNCNARRRALAPDSGVYHRFGSHTVLHKTAGQEVHQQHGRADKCRYDNRQGVPRGRNGR